MTPVQAELLGSFIAEKVTPHLTLHKFIAFVASKDPDEVYPYSDSLACPVTQFVNSLSLFPAEARVNIYQFPVIDYYDITVYPPDNLLLARYRLDNLARDFPRTWGALLDRCHQAAMAVDAA